MHGSLPQARVRLRLATDGSVERLPSVTRAPGPAEVVVRVAGVALGVEPAAEVAGEIVAAGDAAAEWVGRRVVVPRVLPCGECERCRRGRTASCAARAPRDGLASDETVPARYLCSVEPPLWPAELDPAELWRFAALADAVAAPYGAIARAGLAPSELVIVVGGGVRGAAAVALAHAKGATPVILDGDDRRVARALGLGARFAISPDLSPADARAAIAREAHALALPRTGYQLLETTGRAASRAHALALLDDGGTCTFLDCAGGDGEARAPDWERFIAAEGQLLGASACHPDLYPELCALLVRGELPLAPLTTAVSVEDAPAALRAHRGGELLPLPVLRL